jgi:hypothetical protein
VYEDGDRDSDEAAGYDGHTKPLLYNQEAEYASVTSPDYVVAEVRGKTRSTSGASNSSHARAALPRSSTTGSNGGIECAPEDLEAKLVASPMLSRVSATPVLTSAGVRALSGDRKHSKDEWQVFPDDMFPVQNYQYTKAELTARTPWGQFFTHPVARALLVCAFCYVSLYCTC